MAGVELVAEGGALGRGGFAGTCFASAVGLVYAIVFRYSGVDDVPSAPHSSCSASPVELDERGTPFAVAELSVERRDQLIEAAARGVVRRRLDVPAILFLEMHRPLASLASTAVTFAQPTLGALFGFRRMAEWAALLDDRGNIERLIRRIEELVEERSGPGTEGVD